MFRIVSALIVAICVLANTAFAQDLAPSIWKNERGSIMKMLTINPSTGAFWGVYINNAAGFRCQGTPYDVNGRVRGTRIAFRVVWNNYAANCHSRTVWRGRITNHAISTIWMLRRDDGSRLRGTDAFQRQ